MKIDQQNNASAAQLDEATPLSVYHMIHRGSRDWDELEKKLSCDHDNEDEAECPIVSGADGKNEL